MICPDQFWFNDLESCFLVTEVALTKSDGDRLCIDKHPRATQQKFEDDLEFSVVYKMLESMYNCTWL